MQCGLRQNFRPLAYCKVQGLLPNRKGVNERHHATASSHHILTECGSEAQSLSRIQNLVGRAEHQIGRQSHFKIVIELVILSCLQNSLFVLSCRLDRSQTHLAQQHPPAASPPQPCSLQAHPCTPYRSHQHRASH